MLRVPKPREGELRVGVIRGVIPIAAVGPDRGVSPQTAPEPCASTRFGRPELSFRSRVKFLVPAFFWIS